MTNFNGKDEADESIENTDIKESATTILPLSEKGVVTAPTHVAVKTLR